MKCLRLSKYFRSTLLVVLLLMPFTVTTLAHNHKLYAGTAKVNITPEHPRYPVHDSLYARSLVLEADSVRIAFISLDLCVYHSTKIRHILMERYGLTELYMSLSHTHSGENPPEAFLLERLDESMRLAMKDRFEARVSAGHRKFFPIAFNRLIVRDNGRAMESWEADDHYLYINRDCLIHGPVDPSVGVLKLEDLDGNPRALIMNFAAHPDVVWNNFEISADYVGYATKYTEEAFDGKINCLFIQGGAGNQAPLYKDGGRQGPDDPRPANYALIDRMGKLLSIETVKLANSLYPDAKEEGSILVKADSLHFTGRYDKTIQNNIHFSTIVLNGNIAIATCPGEPFIKFQLDWKQRMNDEAIPFLFGYTWNGGRWPNYLPDIRSACLGGFGADNGMPDIIEIGAPEKIFDKILENYYRLTLPLMR